MRWTRPKEARGIKQEEKTGHESDTPEHNKAGIQASKDGHCSMTYPYILAL